MSGYGIELKLSFDRDRSISTAFQLLSMQLGLAMHRLHLRLDPRERGDTVMGDSEISRQLVEISRFQRISVRRRQPPIDRRRDAIKFPSQLRSCVQPADLLVSRGLQNRRQTLRWRSDFLTLAMLLLTMLGFDLMPLKIHRATIIFHGSGELWQMRFRGLAFRAFRAQEPATLTSHGPKPSGPDILARDGARHGSIDALDRRGCGSGMSINESR